ncbi:MAG: SH3 domain-containing protein [Desulfovibrio sp.]
MKKYISFILLAMMLLPSTAYSWGVLASPQQALNIREGRSPSSEKVTTLMPSEKVKIDLLKDGWAAVFTTGTKVRDEKSAIGFCKAKYLVALSPDGLGEYRYADRQLTVRSKRSSKGKHIRTLKKWERVKTRFVQNKWIAVYSKDAKASSEKNALGYSFAKFLVPVNGEMALKDKSLHIPGGAAKEQVVKTVPKVTPKPAPKVVSVEKKVTPKSLPQVTESKVQPKKTQAKSSVKKPVEVKKTATVTPTYSGVKIRKVAYFVQVRKARDESSKKMKILQAGELVKAGFEKDGWVAVFAVNDISPKEKRAIGYVPASALIALDAPLPEDSSELKNVDDTKKILVADKAKQVAIKNQLPKDQGITFEPTTPTAINNTNTVAVKTLGESPKTVKSVKTPVSKVAVNAAPAPAKKQVALSTPNHVKPPKKKIALPSSFTPKKGTIKNLHGVKYSVLDVRDVKAARPKFRQIDILLEVSVLPSDDILKDFCKTVWTKKRINGFETRVEIFLPGMDTRDLSYAVALFNEQYMQEYYTRRAALFGTAYAD